MTLDGHAALQRRRDHGLAATVPSQQVGPVRFTQADDALMVEQRRPVVAVEPGVVLGVTHDEPGGREEEPPGCAFGRGQQRQGALQASDDRQLHPLSDRGRHAGTHLKIGEVTRSDSGEVGVALYQARGDQVALKLDALGGGTGSRLHLFVRSDEGDPAISDGQTK